MFSDRRSFSRIRVDIDAVIFIDDSEIRCSIEDVCEQGICFRVPLKYKKFIFLHQQIPFTFVDNMIMFSRGVTDIVCARGTVRHIDTRDGELFVGCFIPEVFGFGDYVRHKMIMGFIKANPVPKVVVYG